jgi:hypothetical protein
MTDLVPGGRFGGRSPSGVDDAVRSFVALLPVAGFVESSCPTAERLTNGEPARQHTTKSNLILMFNAVLCDHVSRIRIFRFSSKHSAPAIA